MSFNNIHEKKSFILIIIVYTKEHNAHFSFNFTINTFLAELYMLQQINDRIFNDKNIYNFINSIQKGASFRISREILHLNTDCEIIKIYSGAT
jgi:hypothetical protein